MILNTDGSSLGNPGRGGIAVVCDTTPMVMLNIGDNVTNVQAEWIAVIEALRMLKKTAPKEEHEIHTDSELVVNQLHGIYKVKSNRMLYEEAINIINEIDTIKIKHIPREHNQVADGIAKKAAKNPKANYRYFVVESQSDNISIRKDGNIMNFSRQEALELRKRLEDFI